MKENFLVCHYLYTWFLIQVLNPNGISIGSAIFVGLTSVTDRQTNRQTDRPNFSVGNNMSHLHMKYCDAE